MSRVVRYVTFVTWCDGRTVDPALIDRRAPPRPCPAAPGGLGARSPSQRRSVPRGVTPFSPGRYILRDSACLRTRSRDGSKVRDDRNYTDNFGALHTFRCMPWSLNAPLSLSLSLSLSLNRSTPRSFKESQICAEISHLDALSDMLARRAPAPRDHTLREGPNNTCSTHSLPPCSPHGAGTRRVRLVRGEGRGVST